MLFTEMYKTATTTLIELFVCDMTFLDNARPMLASIVNLKSQLSDIIEPEFGLLDHLLRLEVLTRRQYNKVRAGDKAAYERSAAVLELLETEDQCDKFLEALRLTGQQHIANVVTENGGQKNYIII